MGKVYFDSDDNVLAEGSRDFSKFSVQRIWIYPDGRVRFVGKTDAGHAAVEEKIKEGIETGDGNGLLTTETLDLLLGRMDGEDLLRAPEGVAEVGMENVVIGGKPLTQERRKAFFDANRRLFQKVADGLAAGQLKRIKYNGQGSVENIPDNPNEAERALVSLNAHAESYVGHDIARIWYDEPQKPYICGLTADDLVAFAEKNNFQLSHDRAHLLLEDIDHKISYVREHPDEPCGVFELERVGLSADKAYMFVQLNSPVYDTESSDFGKRKLNQYTRYNYIDFTRKFLPEIGYGTHRPDKLPKFKDASGKNPGFSFNDLKCRPFEPLTGPDADVADNVSAMLRCFSGLEVLDDFMKEFPKEAFPNFPDSLHGKDVSGISPDPLEPDKSCSYWHSKEAVDTSSRLIEHLRMYAPKGVQFAYESIYKKQLPAFEKYVLGFWSDIDSGIPAFDFMYDQVASGNHPAFSGGKPDKNGKVRVHVPLTSLKDDDHVSSLGRFYVAGQCHVFDAAKNKGNRDYVIQKDLRLRNVDEYISMPCIEEVRDNSLKRNVKHFSDYPVNFVSVPSGERKKSIPAMSPDPVDYVARFCIASETGCDLSTTQKVMDSARKKLSGWFGKHFCAGEYDVLFAFNDKVEKREKEIIAEMKQAGVTEE